MDPQQRRKCIPCEDKNLKPMTDVEIRQNLSRVPLWAIEVGRDVLVREFVFADFVRAVSFVDMIADIAEEEGHHPDIRIQYNKVLLELSTHSLNGITENDFILAERIDAQTAVLHSTPL
jgi:4a-hydroxytetrahydrobiopterin dehydratase